MWSVFAQLVNARHVTPPFQWPCKGWFLQPSQLGSSNCAQRVQLKLGGLWHTPHSQLSRRISRSRQQPSHLRANKAEKLCAREKIPVKQHTLPRGDTRSGCSLQREPYNIKLEVFDGLMNHYGYAGERHPCCPETCTLLPTHGTKTAGRIAQPFRHHSWLRLLLQVLCHYNNACDKTVTNTNPS